MYTFRRHDGGGGSAPNPLWKYFSQNLQSYTTLNRLLRIYKIQPFSLSPSLHTGGEGVRLRGTLFYQFWSVLKEDCGYILTWLPSDLDENPARGCCCCCCCCCCWGLNQLRIEPSCPNTGQTSKLETQKILWKIRNSVNCLDGSKSNKFSRKYPSVLHIGTGSHM